MVALHKPIDADVRERLSGYDDLTASLLVRRGVETAADAAAFLSPSYDEHIHDPMLIKNMPKAAARLAAAITSGERIGVWSDYDCDGIPGGVVLHDFLKKAGANFTNYIPHRHEEGYGVNEMGIDKLAKDGVKLLITVDSGIVDNDAVAHANALGMEVIITDHHLPSEELPPAFAVIDPKQEGETAPFRDYCGAGLAWKLVCATLAHGFKGREAIPEGWEKWLLDMAGLATIADMVPLTGENRVIAKYGLLVMRKSPRIGLQKLLKIARVNQRFVSEDDVGFMVAPRVNAASRMGDPRDAFTLLTTSDESEADRLAKDLEKANRGRRSAAAAITRAVHERLHKRESIPSVIALGDPDWRPGLLGLVANGIAEEYERPVFLWGREATMKVKGSCRSGGGAHVVELMQAAGDTFLEFGGHAKSGGFSLAEDAVFSFEENLCRAYETLSFADDGNRFALADQELTPEEATPELLQKVNRLAPYGMGNEKPVFLFRNVSLVKVEWFGKANEHLKLKIARGLSFDNGPIDAIAFYAKRELGKVCETIADRSSATVLGSLERDQFSRGAPIRLRIVSIS
ncbi:MAG: single-stranded-DNA-specific exonuclease RecJ [Parcubacteria bacterium C7867-001]|nr:MAG: single-stranded-DNA-specific exonuclease RecJ [Parcubacteria bacterium C7867-001]